MARTVSEVMNRELFGVPEDAHADDVLEAILAYGITAVPVLDDERRPIGVTSLRDLLRADRGAKIARPALTVGPGATLEQAATTMDDAGCHHLVVIDEEGRAVGMLSSLDLVRALIGRPVKHPSTFPHRDRRFGITWSDDEALDAARVEVAPDAPGILVLVRGEVGIEDIVVWVEAVHSLRARVRELVELPQDDEPALARILARRKGLRFRCAVVTDAAERASLARTLREVADAQFLPRASAAALSDERSVEP